MAIQRAARWQWALETNDGTYIAGVAIVPDHTGLKRGWFTGFPGKALVSGVQLKPVIKLSKMLFDADVFDELRAWIMADDPQAIGIARRFGFSYDCGPATGLSPTGRDMALFRWSKSK